MADTFGLLKAETESEIIFSKRPLKMPANVLDK